MQVIINSASSWVFAVGAVLMCAWCLFVLVACMFVQTPNSTAFPEVDVISRVLESSSDATESPQFSALNNSTSRQVIKHLRGRRLFIRIIDKKVIINFTGEGAKVGQYD